MTVFKSDEHFYTVMRDVFAAVAKQPKSLESIERSNLVIRINTLNPGAEILVDGRQPPLEVFYGTRPGKANLQIEMEADLLHYIWLGQQSMREAFFGGKIKTTGSMLKLMTLAQFFFECEKVYPQIAELHNLEG